MEVAGNRLTLLADGPERLEALIALIDGARESLRILYYIWENDKAGRRVRDALLAAAERGVHVSLLVDGFGASGAPKDFFEPLIEAQARFCRFVPRWGRRYLLRNHQKLALADGHKAIVGGFNISDDYFGTIEDGAWRDLGLQVEGPSVAFLVRYFEALFTWAEMPDASIRRLRRMLSQYSVRDGPLHWLFGGPTRRLSPWARSVKDDLMQARQVDIISAYFAPSLSMMRRLVRGRPARARPHRHAGEARPPVPGRGGAIPLLAPVEARRRDLRISGDQAPLEADRDRRRGPYRLGQFRLEEPLSQPRDDAARRRSRLRGHDAPLRRRRDRQQQADHARGASGEHDLVEPAAMGFAYFMVATADYNLSRRLNFRKMSFGGAEQIGTTLGLPAPEQVAGRDVDPFEAALDAVEMGGHEVAHLGLELVDEEGAARAQRRRGLRGDLRADARRQSREGQAREDVIGMVKPQSAMICRTSAAEPLTASSRLSRNLALR